jgi:hypothetical protein
MKRESSSEPHRVMGKVQRAAASQALVGGGCATAAMRALVGVGVRWCLGGAECFFEGASLFSRGKGSVLPKALSVPVTLLASLEIGQRCRFSALRVANLCLHNLHCQCGQPWAASAAFQLSHLTVRVLLHARCFFSFWAWVAILVPFTRLKKAWWPS